MTAPLRMLTRPVAAARLALPRLSARAFQTSRVLRQEAGAAVQKKPVGAFRGGIFGFLLGSAISGAAAYFYLLEEYKTSNELLTEDIDALRNTIQRIEKYVRGVEERLAEQEAAAKKGRK
ncbi:hypothetical protein RUND412_006217 [Rhizina undulata]